MKQEDKELLLKDLCARLPYETLISIDGDCNKYRMEEICNALIGIDTFKITIDGYGIEHIKPYLLHLSSMTEEQEIEYDATFETIVYEDGRKDSVMTYKSFDWLNANHFDYRGLIEKGLAINATSLNIY